MDTLINTQMRKDFMSNRNLCIKIGRNCKSKLLRDTSVFYLEGATIKFVGGGGITFFCCTEGGITFLLYLLNLINMCVLHTWGMLLNMIQVYYDCHHIDWFWVLWSSVLSVECFGTQFCWLDTLTTCSSQIIEKFY